MKNPLPKENRASMRVNMVGKPEITVTIGPHSKGHLYDLCKNGMFLETLAFFPEKSTLPFQMVLPNGIQCSGSGRVAWRSNKRTGIGIEFQSLSDQSKSVITTFLSDNALLGSLRELKVRYPFLNSDGMVAFTNKKKIDFFIQEALKSRAEITVINSHSKITVPLELTKVNNSAFCYLRGKDLDGIFRSSNTIFVSFQHGYATYNFESRVYQITDDGNGMTCLYPRLLFYSEKRALCRARTEKGLRVEISLPSPFNTIIRGDVKDISDGGISIITDDHSTALLPGTPLKSVRVIKGNKLIREVWGEVRNVKKTHSRDIKKIRYGIQFGIARQAITAAETPVFDTVSRPATETRKELDPGRLAHELPEVIRLENKKGEEIVGLLNSSLKLRREPVPVVIIPPAFGKTKETLFALTLTLVTNFYLLGRPLVVIRYDGIRRKGESYKDPDASEPPNEMINACISQGAEDLKAVLDWIEANPRFKASSVILVTFSLSALEARLFLRDESYRKKVDYWIPCMGTPELRHLLTRVNCGLDLLEQYQLGIKLGTMPVLGNLVNVDMYMEDSVNNQITTLDQARKDMKDLNIPITWIYGEHDHWVKAEFIRDVMGIAADGSREVLSIPLGHSARTSADALKMFGIVTSLVYRFLHKKMIKSRIPEKSDLDYMRRAEKDRLPSRNLKDREEYWHRYLVGEEELLGFDVLMLADDYQQLMNDQVHALELKPEDRLLDLGGGTGNFIEHIITSNTPLPHEITLADLIPEALEQAKSKLGPMLERSPYKCSLKTQLCDIEMNRYLPVQRFIEGEFFSFKEFVEKIENLTVQTTDKISDRYSPRLHKILRGEKISPQDRDWLKRSFELPEYRAVLDINQASRIVRGIKKGNPRYKSLVFSPDFTSKRQLPFQPGKYNKIIMSLVLSYIFNPLETLMELKRILRSGGLLVVSSVRPDGDASGLFTRLVEKVEKMPDERLPGGWDRQVVLKSIRSFLNDAQALVDLEEAGTFDFFDQERLYSLLLEAGFHNIKTIETFGDPPQGYICVARRGIEND